MARINSGVGNNALNAANDQVTVINLLNKTPRQSGGPSEPLGLNVLSGKPSMRLVQAIIAFQQVNLPLRKPDGRVDPDGPTLEKLNQLSGAGGGGAEAEQFAANMIRFYAQTLAGPGKIVLPSELRPYIVTAVDERDTTASYLTIWKQHREAVRASTRGNANAAAIEMFLNQMERTIERGQMPRMPKAAVFGLATTDSRGATRRHAGTILGIGGRVSTASGVSPDEQVIVLMGDMGLIKLGSDSLFIVLGDTQAMQRKVPATAILTEGQLSRHLAELAGKHPTAHAR